MQKRTQEALYNQQNNGKTNPKRTQTNPRSSSAGCRNSFRISLVFRVAKSEPKRTPAAGKVRSKPDHRLEVSVGRRSWTITSLPCTVTPGAWETAWERLSSLLKCSHDSAPHRSQAAAAEILGELRRSEPAAYSSASSHRSQPVSVLFCRALHQGLPDSN